MYKENDIFDHKEERKMRNLLYTFMLLSISTGLFAQFPAQRSITTIEGLSQNDVNCIFQDSRGFMWFGTNDGLNRYDGYDFEIFRIEPGSKSGLSSNLIFCIDEDKNGNLWLGTTDNGVIKLDFSNHNFVTYNNEDRAKPLLVEGNTASILCEDNGLVWIGSDDGLTIFNTNYTQSQAGFSLRFDSLEIDGQSFDLKNVKQIFRSKEGAILLSTSLGLLLSTFDVSRNEAAFIRIGAFGRLNNIQSLCQTPYGIVLNSDFKVMFLKLNANNPAESILVDVAEIRGSHIVYDDMQHLWVGGNSGLSIYEPDFSGNAQSQIVHRIAEISNVSDKDSDSKTIVTALYKDRTGIIWAGTNGKGVIVINTNQKPFRLYSKEDVPGSLVYNKIRGLYEDSQNNLWVGTDGGGLSFLPASQMDNYETGFISLNVNEQTYQNSAYTFTEIPSKKNLIVAGVTFPQKLVLIENRKNRLLLDDYGFLMKNMVFSSLTTSDGSVWLGTYGDGLYKVPEGFNGKDTKLLHYSENGKEGYRLSNRIVRSLFEDFDGNIWIGTGKGVNLIMRSERNKEHPKIKVFQHHNDEMSLSHDYILPIFQSKDSTVWVGTMGGGLNKVVADKDFNNVRFESITSEQGLPNNVIKGILEDDNGNLWISSNRGLSKMGIKTGLIHNFDISDGLQDYEFGELACVRRRNGDMVFGGVHGLNVFNPDDIIIDTTSSQVIFSKLQVLNRDISVGEKVRGRVILNKDINEIDNLKLSYAENSFSIHFSSLHYAAPSKNMYEYRLIGFDEEWIKTDANDRVAKYTNLMPGRYLLEVRGSNSDHLFSKESKFLTIRVVPPIWMSSFAFIVYFIIIVLILMFFRRYSFIRINRKNELMMEHFEREKVQELSQMKLRFFTNISHEFRTPLTLIMSPLEKLMKQGNEMDQEARDHQYNVMYRNASILSRLITQLMNFRKVEQGKMKLNVSRGNIVEMARQAYLAFEEHASSRNIQFKLEYSDNLIELWFDPEQVERILFNLLSNAFKFTNSGGTISLIINEKTLNNREVVEIQVKDTGVGIEKDKLKYIFERFFQANKHELSKVSGTGIGLSFAKSLVDLHKGEIRVESKVGEGSNFIVMLRKGKMHFSKDELSSQKIESSQTTIINRPIPIHTPSQINTVVDEKEDGKKPKILVVEDNMDVRGVIRDYLGGQFAIYEAENGVEGLAVCADKNPDLIISDVMMPEMDGYEMIKRLKQDENSSHIPIILLTARSSETDQLEGLEIGAEAYIPKPFSIEIVTAQVNSIIESRKAIWKRFQKSLNITPNEIAMTSIDEKFLGRVLKIVEANMHDPEFTVKRLADDYGTSQVLLNKKLKALTGQTANVFIRTIRLKRAAQLLKKGRFLVADVVYEVGFSDFKYFRKCFKSQFGMNPSEYLKQQRKAEDKDDGVTE